MSSHKETKEWLQKAWVGRLKNRGMFGRVEEELQWVLDGDMLPSPNFVTKASLLVVQQQRIRGRFVKHNVNASLVPNQRDHLVHDVPIHETFIHSCTISMDKYEKM